MNKSNIFILLIAVQLLQVFAGGSGLSFDVNRATAYMNAGNCFVYPGLSTSGSSNNIGYRYYSLPYGWRQYENKLYIPNLLSSRGDWVFGAKAVSGDSSVNEQFKINVNGLQIKISPASSYTSKNLVIGSNYRSDGVSDKDWSDFTSSLSRGDGWFEGSSSGYWYPGQSVRVTTTTPVRTAYGVNLGSSYSSYPTSFGGDFDNLFSNYGDDSNVRTNVIYSTSTPSQVFISTGPTDDDRKSALDQQYKANKALNDLNTLIGQLSANVDSTKSSVARYESDLSGYRSTSSQCNDKILELNNAKLSADSSIRTLNSQINEYKTRLADFTPALSSLLQRRAQLVQSRDSIERSKSPNSNLLGQLEGKYSSCNSQVDEYRADYSKVQSSIESNNNEISTIQNNAADAPNQIRLANQQLTVVDATIADLEAKLSDARAQKAKIQGDIVNYNNVIRSSNNQVSTLKSQNARLTGQLSTLQSSIDTQVFQCSTYQRQSEEIRSKIASTQSDYDSLVNQISVQDSLIANKRSEIDRFQSETSNLPSRLSTLQNDLNNAQTALSRQYYICNQASETVSRAESDLRAANLKLQTEQKFLSDAQSKLSSATAQKKAADDLVNKLLSAPVSGTTGGSTGGSTSIRITGGISGVATGGDSSTGYIYSTPTTVGSIGDYLGRVYGSSVKTYWEPYTSSSATTYSTMYPLSSTTMNALYGRSDAGVFLPSGSTYLSGITSSQIGSSSLPSNIVGDFTCSGSGNSVQSGYGKVTSVQPGYITISTPSSGNINLRIGSCSRLESNRPQFVASVYDNVFYKGQRGLNKDVHAHYITCLS